ncbi:hypothetical protein niasHS_011092 [Heterodera schachtii]|uniref:Ras suppressor protein n=1 Tax=Heterodera schachtii TaxID=97005 RepID=A0ABD2J048_HETSC
MPKNDRSVHPPHSQSAPAEDNTEIDCVDRGIHNFGQLRLNFENSRVTRLTLSHNKLTSIPANISDLVNLEQLNLWNNHIEELPVTISALPNLKLLNVGLPGNFFFMPTLRALYFGDNDFESFPEDIGHLTNLQVLVLRENDLIDLPRQMGTLQKLKELHIQGNRLQVIPPELGQLDLIDPNDENAKTLRVENNPWIVPLKDALTRGAQGGDWQSGVESFWNYIRSDNYRRLYESHPVGVGSPPPKRNKEKKVSRVKGSAAGGAAEGSRGQNRERTE